MSFTNNTALQGHTMYAEDISRCTSTPNVSTKSAGSIYKQSFFSFIDIFEYSQTNVTRYVDFSQVFTKLVILICTIGILPLPHLT